MRANWLNESLRSVLARFRAARGGNVVMTFALATIPIIGFVGAAVDYSHANSIKAAMQAALDATALAMSKTAGSLTDADLQQKSNTYFKALFTRPEATNVIISVSYDKQASSLTVSGTALMNTNVMGVVGFKQLTITGSSIVSWGTTKLQVALALDNTGSMMEYGKITALKTATHSLLTMLQAAATNPSDVQVAIIPFSKDVNVGTSNVNASWIDWTAWNAANASSSTSFSGSICYQGTLWQVNGSSWTNGGSCSGSGGGICYNGTLWTWNGTTFVNGGSCTANVNHSSWNGCVTDRTQDYDTTNTSPSSSVPATLFPAEQYGACPVAMMGLSNNWASLNALVDQMLPNGYTNQAIGLAWAWQALTQSIPMNAPVKGPDVQQIIILLTDGLNTEDRWYTNQASIDARQQILCNNIKAAKITIYTVQVNTSGDPTSTLLKNCASDTGKFFLLTTANGIVTTFSQIGTNLAKLHIAK